MLHTARSCGLAPSTAASMVTLPVVNAPTLPCRRRISSAWVHGASPGLASTSKNSRNRSTTSGKTARVTRTAGFIDAPIVSMRLHGRHDALLVRRVGMPAEGEQHDRKPEQVTHRDVPAVLQPVGHRACLRE